MLLLFSLKLQCYLLPDSCLFSNSSPATQHAELRGRVGHYAQRGSTADILISSGSCGTACPSLPAGSVYPVATVMTRHMGKVCDDIAVSFCFILNVYNSKSDQPLAILFLRHGARKSKTCWKLNLSWKHSWFTVTCSSFNKWKCF